MPAQIVPLLGTQTVSSGRNIINNNFTYLDLNKLGAFGITTPNVINCTASAGVIKECGTLSVLNGHLTIEGVTSTGATGTGQFVFHTSPTFAGTLTALHGTFTGNLTGLGTLNSEKSVSACGVVGDKSTDDTTALNSCISGMPDYSTLIIPLGYQIKVTTSVIIHGKHGIKIKAMTSSNGGPTTASGVPAIFWYGADGGTVIDIDDVGDSLFEGFSVYTSSGFTTGTAGASVAINVDQTTGLGVTTTNDIFDRIGIYGTQQRSSFVGIRFSNVSTSNVEHMAVRNSTIFCSYSTDQNSAVGKGITIGASANALGHNYEWTSINQCAVAIDTGSGGVAHITKNQLNSNGIHITGNSTQSLDISDNDSENTNQFFKGSGYNLRFSSNRMASCTPPSVTGCVQLTNGRVALFENNSFTAGAYYGVSSDGGGGITMMSRGNAYPDVTNTLAGWATFNGLVTTQHDICGGTLCTSELASAGNAFATAPTPRAGVGLIHYEQTTGRWRVSGNGAAFTDIPSTAAAVYGLFSGTHDATTCTAGDGTMQPCGGAPGNLTRTLPVSTVTNNAVDIGTFYGVTSFYGLANYSISISAGSPINVAKIYQVAISGDGANVWRKVLPISSTGTANGDGSDFDLEVKTDGNPITYFRIRKTAGSSTVALKINLVQNSGVADFTGSTATSSPSAPTTIWPTTGTVALAGTTGSIGGGALAASCATGTATVLGATTDMAATASPAGGVDPIGSAPAVSLSARVSAADTVTVSLCGTGTPTAAAYNVRVVQ